MDVNAGNHLFPRNNRSSFFLKLFAIEIGQPSLEIFIPIVLPDVIEGSTPKKNALSFLKRKSGARKS